MGVEAAAGETPSLTGEVVGETHRGLERTQAHPLGNQHQRGPVCLWVAGEVTENGQRVEQVPLFPLRPLPHIQRRSTATSVTPPHEHLQLLPLLPDRWAQTKAPEKIQLSDEEIANLSDPQFKTLVIRILTELVEYGRKLEEKMKAMKSEIKENV